MAERPLSILQVNTLDTEGGVANVVRNLFLAYRARGHGSWLAVGRKRCNEPNIFGIPDEIGWIHRASGYVALQVKLTRLASQFPGKGWGLISRWLRLLTHPRTLAETYRGVEDFNFPGTYRLLDLSPKLPGIVHCHNLHGGYFDLRALPWLSHQVPVVLTLHDAWLLSGHCSHSFDCERWTIGCGQCPDLTIYPAIHRDATAFNWQRKREIYARSRLYVATPSRWLMGRVEQSMIAPAIAHARIIPNGIDLSIFRPADKRVVRAAMGIPQDVSLLLFVTSSIPRDAYKDYRTMQVAVAHVGERLRSKDVLLVVLGEHGPAERVGQVEVQFVPYQRDPQAVARYYQAADLYMHPARTDNFPSTVLEALACGTPVVATAVGGIPEQVKPLQVGTSNCSNVSSFPRLEETTGVLVPPGDAEAMAEAVFTLLKNDVLRSCLGNNAARDARERFDLEAQVEAYLEWYQNILKDWDLECSPSQRQFGARNLTGP